MDENKKTWSDAEKLVSELISDARSQAKRWFIAFFSDAGSTIWNKHLLDLPVEQLRLCITGRSWI